MVKKFKQNIVEKVGGNSCHHLFDYFEVREKLTSLFGEPETDKDHEILQKRAKKCMNVIPCFVIEQNIHNEYHKKIKSHLSIKSRIKKESKK